MATGTYVNRVGSSGSYGFYGGSRTYSFQHNATVWTGTCAFQSAWSVAAIRSHTETPTVWSGTVTLSYNAILVVRSVIVTVNALATITAAMQTIAGSPSVETRLITPSAGAGTVSLPTWTLATGPLQTPSIMTGTCVLQSFAGVANGHKNTIVIWGGTSAFQTASILRGGVISTTTAFEGTVSLYTATPLPQRVVTETPVVWGGLADLGAETLRMDYAGAQTIWVGTAAFQTASDASSRIVAQTPTVWSGTVSLRTSSSILAPTAQTPTIWGGTGTLGTSSVAAKVTVSHTPTAFAGAASFPTHNLQYQVTIAASQWAVTSGFSVMEQACSCVFVIGEGSSVIHIMTSAMESSVSALVSSLLQGSIITPASIRTNVTQPTALPLVGPA